ncbi:hypothetical protein RMB03_00470 [Acinetobacter sp. V91_7]|uniref:hypothetical protein n=1 Tax=unclassified Acinetobacter TaxID=196816 RepID=UPI00287F3089|nr:MULTISPECIES: hypothetical protein [unclassified Acinetobacter]MDS7932467.1 hypothetical protein [Acinetobacter sp. V91_4B]MDS7961440.1 hypothetical protein [Acinetobacter sp. V91_7]MDS8025941.1 hypothetical protein [Acinetobacter sp. V91_13]
MGTSVHWMEASVDIGRDQKVTKQIYFYKEQLLHKGKDLSDLSYRDIESGLKQQYDETIQIRVLIDLGVHGINKYKSSLRND